MKLIPALAALALLTLAAAPGGAQAAPHPAAHRPPGTVVTDPPAFVGQVYARLKKGGDYQPPEDIYPPRLAGLWANMNRDAKDEVPRIEFLFWINGQDGDISEVKLSSRGVEQRAQNDRRVVVVTFTNTGHPEELHYYFERTKAGWKLDDVSSVVGGDEGGWTLSVLLKYGDDRVDNN